MPITALPTPPSRSDPANFATRGDAFLAALSTFAAEANALAVAMNLNSTTDASTSSVLIGIGNKTFAVSAGKSFAPGMYLVIADAAAPVTNSMWGQVVSYAGTALVVSVIGVRGSGTKFSWAISQSAPGGASAGANGDITSLSGLTTALSIAQGGTGAITADAAADALGAYRKGTLLGNVAQSSGVPTGAVMDTIKNANGTALLLADGTQICVASFAAVTLAPGSVAWTWTYPAVFSVTPPYVSPRLVGAASGAWKIETEGSSNSAATGFVFNTDSTSKTVAHNYVAIGRWI